MVGPKKVFFVGQFRFIGLLDRKMVAGVLLHQSLQLIIVIVSHTLSWRIHHNTRSLKDEVVKSFPRAVKRLCLILLRVLSGNFREKWKRIRGRGGG